MSQQDITTFLNMVKKKDGITPKTSIGDAIKRKAEKVGKKVFLTYIRDFDKGIEEKYTYKDMHIQSNRLANGLLKLGLKNGDGISIFEINSPEYIFSLFSAWKLGCYVVLVNVGLRGDGLQYIIDHSDSKAFLLHWTLVDAYLNIKNNLPKIEHVIIDINEAPADFKLPDGTISLQSVLEASDADIEVEIDPTAIAYLIYTSGTTGLPKATSFFYGKSLMGDAVAFMGLLAFAMGRPGDVFYTCLPLFHGNALQLTTMPGFMMEWPVVLSKRFSATRFWDIIRKYKITNFNLLGSMPQYLLKQPPREDDKDNKVWRVNSAACPKELIRDFEERFDLKVYEGYGAVDGGGFFLGTYGRDAEKPPVGTMGKPAANMIAEIMDDDGKIFTEPENVGELVFLVKEDEKAQRQVKYYKDESASKSLIQKGADGQLWFHTGDLATKDKDGWFFFVDRKKDSIRRRGENIAAWSIERVINGHDKVLESAAYGIKSSQVGEDYAEDEVMVAIVLKPGESITPEEILEHCDGKLATFQIPRFIEFVDKLPKSEVHRIMKRYLKDQGVSEKTYDRESGSFFKKP